MTSENDTQPLDVWVARTRRMVDYVDEARDFVNRAGAQIPTLDADVSIVCHLWAIADEQDAAMCETLDSFGNALFGAGWELDITRGVEARDPMGSGVPSVVYICTWAARRAERERVGIVLSAEQGRGVVGMEIRSSGGDSRQVGFPPAEPSHLYEALSRAFFEAVDG